MHIGKILESSKVNPDNISREGIDRILWYFFRKGSNKKNYEKIEIKYKELVYPEEL